MKQSIQIHVWGRMFTPKDVYERLAPLLSKMSLRAIDGEMTYYQGDIDGVGLNAQISFVNVSEVEDIYEEEHYE